VDMMIESYLFFIIFVPIIIAGYFILMYLDEEKYKYTQYILISAILLFGHIILPYFNVGIFPHLTYDFLFYALLFASGMIFSILFIKYIKKRTFKEIGWDSSNILKDIIIGFFFGLLLLIIAALLTALSQDLALDQISFSSEKIITVIFFAAGAIYEEILFRGAMQKDLEQKYSIKKAIIIQGLAFFAINLFYFPFDIGGIISYGIMLFLSFLMGILAYKYSLYCSTTAHVIFVLLAGLLI